MIEQLQPDADPIRNAFAPLIGLPAWLVRKGHASCLTLEFGQPHLEIREPPTSCANSGWIRRYFSRRQITPRGEWHLWINCCHWRVIRSGNVVAWSESSDEAIIKAALQIDSLILTNTKVNHRNQTSEFAFESDTTINMWPDEEDDSPQWMLFQPSGDVLTYRADGLYSLGPGNQPPDEKVWQTLS
jgi:hypothetical protein